MHERLRKANSNYEIDLGEIFKAIWAGKWIIIAFTFLTSVGSVLYSLSLPDIYKSEITLAPVQEEGLKMPGQLSGLAALAGVNIGSSSGDKAALAFELLKSRDFISRFIEDNNLYVPIMAAKGWQRSDDTLVLDAEIYDGNSQKWVRQVKPPFVSKPSNQETYEIFKKFYSVSQNKSSGMYSISIEYYSPYLAKEWADKLVNTINEEMRSLDLNEAQKSIDYLNTQVNQTNISDVRGMLYSLIEEQMKTQMLANVRSEYVFKTIDPAVVAELKSKPARALICLLGFMFGFIFSVIVVLVKRFIINNEHE